MASRPIPNIAIFASGGGSNASNILQHFSQSEVANVSLLCTHNPTSGVFQFGPNFNCPVHLLRSEQYQSGRYLTSLCMHYKIDWIALAGYLKKIPESLIDNFPGRILNIHPSLLPDFGGKGMYGMRVHEAVIAAKAERSGMTIHRVNAAYDDGEILFQAALQIPDKASPSSLQKAVLKLEHKYYPQIIENAILSYGK